MKPFLYSLFFVCIAMSCNHPNNEIKERIANSDSVAISYFKGDGTMDTVVAVKIIRDHQQMEQLTGMIAQRTVEGKYDCGYDGSLHFFKMNKVIQDINFSMRADSCLYFSFVQNGKAQATVLSRAAKELINSFRSPLTPKEGN